MSLSSETGILGVFSDGSSAASAIPVGTDSEEDEKYSDGSSDGGRSDSGLDSAYQSSRRVVGSRVRVSVGRRQSRSRSPHSGVGSVGGVAPASGVAGASSADAREHGVVAGLPAEASGEQFSAAARVRGRTFFVTFGHTEQASAVLLQSVMHARMFSAVLRSKVCTYCLVFRETHADGGHHLHCLLQFDKRLDMTMVSFRALLRKLVPDCNEIHVKNVVYKKHVDCIVNEYCKKEDANPLSDGFLDESCFIKEKKDKVGERAALSAECLSKLDAGESIKDVLLFLCSKNPYWYVSERQKLERNFADHVRCVRPLALVSEPVSLPAGVEQPALPQPLQSWLGHAFAEERDVRLPVLFLYGAALLCKTTWARSLGKHMYFKNEFNCLKWASEATYIVFDDVDWKKYTDSQWKSLLNCGEFEWHTGIMQRRTFHHNFPVIFICNALPAWREDARNYWRSVGIMYKCLQPLLKFND